MEIGIHGFRLDDVKYYEELGVTWCKWPGEFFPLEREERAGMAAAREAGLQVVMDLRTSGDALTKAWDVAMQETGGDEEAATVRVVEQVAAAAAAFVSRHKDLCSNWEFWGECYCPWVSDGVFNDKVTYTALLTAFYGAVKAAQPEARVWTGGNGTNMDPEWVIALLQDNCGAYFDVLNLHPFFISLRDLVVTSRHMDRSLGYMRERLQVDALNQPFAATEWGHPHTPERRQLRSNVIGGLLSLDYEEIGRAHV